MVTSVLIIMEVERAWLTSISTSGHKHRAGVCGEEHETAPMPSSGCRSSSSTTLNRVTSSSNRWSPGRRRATAGRAAHRGPASCAGRSSALTRTCTCTGVIRGSAARSAGGSRSCPTRRESTRPCSGGTGEVCRTIVATTKGHGRRRRWRSAPSRGDCWRLPKICTTHART